MKNKTQKYKYVVYAISDMGEGYVQEISRCEDVEDIKIFVGMFSPDIKIEIEKEYEK